MTKVDWIAGSATVGLALIAYACAAEGRWSSRTDFELFEARASVEMEYDGSQPLTLNGGPNLTPVNIEARDANGNVVASQNGFAAGSSMTIPPGSTVSLTVPPPPPPPPPPPSGGSGGGIAEQAASPEARSLETWDVSVFVPLDSGYRLVDLAITLPADANERRVTDLAVELASQGAGARIPRNVRVDGLLEVIEEGANYRLHVADVTTTFHAFDLTVDGASIASLGQGAVAQSLANGWQRVEVVGNASSTFDDDNKVELRWRVDGEAAELHYSNHLRLQ